MNPNPCNGCQSFGKCSGSCWVTEMAEMYRRIDEDAATPEGQAFLAAVMESCVPLVRHGEWQGGPWGRGF